MGLKKYTLYNKPNLKFFRRNNTKLKWFTSFFKFIANICNVYIPTLAFTILFAVFIVQIFFRYFLNSPLTWTYEVTVVAYTWVAILSAGYARKVHEHVAFGVVYDKLNAKWQTIFRILGNILISVTYIMLLSPSYKQISFLSYKQTSVFKIPLNIVFFPFLVFLFFVIIYSLIDIYLDIKRLKKGDF